MKRIESEKTHPPTPVSFASLCLYLPLSSAIREQNFADLIPRNDIISTTLRVPAASAEKNLFTWRTQA